MFIVSRLSVTPHGKKPHQALGWRMLIAYNPSLLPGRTRHFSYRLTVVNQLSENLSLIQGNSYQHSLINWFIFLIGLCVLCQWFRSVLKFKY